MGELSEIILFCKSDPCKEVRSVNERDSKSHYDFLGEIPRFDSKFYIDYSVMKGS